MKRRALIVDVAKCINCQNCVLVTKDEHVGNDFPGYAAAQPAGGHEWITIKQYTRGSGTMVDVAYVPTTCNHCDRAPCIEAAGDGSIYKREDGVVIIDPLKAKGRRDLVDACPYGSISWNESAQLPQKWIFDAHLLDSGWSQPRCEQVCPTGALQSVYETDAALVERVTRDRLEVLRPELETQPRVFYRNLQKALGCFIGGNVIASNAQGLTDNLVGAKVELFVDGQDARGAVTDPFGDFKIDGLAATGTEYSLFVRHEGFGEVHRSGTLQGSENLGSIALEPRAGQLVG